MFAFDLLERINYDLIYQINVPILDKKYYGKFNNEINIMFTCHICT